MTDPSLPSELSREIDKEYAAFLDRLKLLEKERNDLIKEYGKKLGLKKIQRLRDHLLKH